LVLAGKFVFKSDRLLVAGIFVSKTGTLLMADILVLPPLTALELVAEASVELPGVFWLQPTNANAAKAAIAKGVIIDFMSVKFRICYRQPDIRRSY
jgi:hypothetical protein